MAEIPARHPVNGAPGPVCGLVEATGGVMRERDPGEAEEDAGIARVGTDGDLLAGYGLVAAPDERERRSEAAMRQRAVGVEIDRALHRRDRGVVAMQAPCADAIGPVRVFVGAVQFD